MSANLPPGIHPDIANDDYHADPVEGWSLSSSEAQLILDSPAKLRYQKSHRTPPTSDMSFGSAAHKLVLGTGDDITVIDANDWRTNAAKAARDEAIAAGAIPVLTKDMSIIEQMAEALKGHPVARLLFDSERGGAPEQTLVWHDDASGVTCRAKLDWLPPVPKRGRLIVPDYKTAHSARPQTFARSVANFGYHMQASWYLDGVRALCGVTDPAFVFIVQEKEPPFLVSVIELDPFALHVGASRNQEARELFARCVEADEWPGYGSEVEMAALPRWAEAEFEREQEEAF